MTRHLLRIPSIATALLLVAFATAGAVAARPTQTSAAPLTWYWSPGYVQQVLRKNGLTWPNGHNSVRGVKCSGLGRWIVKGTTPMYTDLYCYVQPVGGAVYKIIFHVVDQSTYRFDFAGYQRKQTWWWTAQNAANTLVQGGIQNGEQHVDVASSTCSSFGPSRQIKGSIYHFLFYCSAEPTSGYPEAIVLDVSDQTSANVTFVSYTQQLAATPTNTTPVPSSNTSNSQLLDQFLAQQETAQMMQEHETEMNYLQWGTDHAPSPGEILLGAVGCAADPNDDHVYKNYDAC
jgi:hypothetical protein